LVVFSLSSTRQPANSRSQKYEWISAPPAQESGWRYGVLVVVSIRSLVPDQKRVDQQIKLTTPP
jgi:hypothetical protein